MTKKEFCKKLNKLIKSLPKNTRDSYINYYEEIINDYIENGDTECEAVGKLGKLDYISDEIMSDNADIIKKQNYILWGIICLSLAVISILLHIFSRGIFRHYEAAYYNLRELSLILGLFFSLMCVENLFFRYRRTYMIKVTVWILLFFILCGRFITPQLFCSIVMNSVYAFWFFLLLLIVYSILMFRRKIHEKN